MKLKIQNLGKIANAEIAFDGITVIAGDNNTGKSTVGKALFAFFNSLKDIKVNIDIYRDGLEKFTLKHILSEYIQEKNLHVINYWDDYRFIDHMHDIHSMKQEDLIEPIQKFFLSKLNYSLSREDECFNRLLGRLKEVRNVPDEDVERALIQNYWGDIFSGQINSLQNDLGAMVDLTIRDTRFGMDFGGNQCLALEVPFKIMNKAIFIHSPYILDRINGARGIENLYISNTRSMDDKLLSLLKQEKSYNAVADVLRRKRIDKVTTALNALLPGDFFKNDDGELIYKRTGYREGLKVNNLSTGLKSFAVLDLLVNKAVLDEKDVLIFDEPEVNLHPAWQLKYAELIVLLQKAFDLTVLFNTHSPYFLHAIEVYSAKHGVADRCKYYLAENQGDIASFQDVTGQTEEIYRKMLKPFEDLQGVAYDEP